jgi:hypothetical protein
MRNLGVLAVAILIGISAVAQTSKSAAPPAGQNAIIITFKDGHQQSFALTDVAKIEFKTNTAQASRSDRALFTGEWKVGTGAGGDTFLLTLAADGTATKNIGSLRGTWEVVGNQAQITWDDGWRDVIRRSGGRWEKAAYAPGRALTDSPSNVTRAARTEPM